MIVNIRATSGAGKTWLARRLLEQSGAVPVRWEDTHAKHRPVVYGGRFNGGPVYVVGYYPEHSHTGGCDKFAWPGGQDYTCALVREFAALGHVVFEGLMVSTIESRYAYLAHELPCTFAFLDTPLEVCLQRVQGRRGEKGTEKALDPSNTTNKVTAIKVCRAKFAAAGLACVTLPWQDPWPALAALLP